MSSITARLVLVGNQGSQIRLCSNKTIELKTWKTESSWNRVAAAFYFSAVIEGRALHSVSEIWDIQQSRIPRRVHIKAIFIWITYLKGLSSLCVKWSASISVVGETCTPQSCSWHCGTITSFPSASEAVLSPAEALLTAATAGWAAGDLSHHPGNDPFGQWSFLAMFQDHWCGQIRQTSSSVAAWGKRGDKVELQGFQQEKTLKHRDMFPSNNQIQEVGFWVVIKW